MGCKEELRNGSFCRLDATTPDGYCRWHFLLRSYLVQLPLGRWASFPALVVACWAGASAFLVLVQFVTDFDVGNVSNAITFGGWAMICGGYGMIWREAREVVWPRIMNWGILLLGAGYAGGAVARIVSSRSSEVPVAFWVNEVGLIIAGVMFAASAVLEGRLRLPRWMMNVAAGILLASLMAGRVLEGASVGQIVIWCALIGWYVEFQYGLIRSLFKSF
jgi:hypothetical protein